MKGRGLADGGREMTRETKRARDDRWKSITDEIRRERDKLEN